MIRKNRRLRCLLWAGLGTLGMFAVAPLWAEALYPFDRVFTSPQERAILDKLRHQSDQGAENFAQSPSSSDVPAPLSRKVTVSGLLIRADGKNVVWLDGKSPLSPSGTESAVKAVLPKNGATSVMVKTPSAAKSLKPGQVWLIESNQVKESYEVIEKSEQLKPESFNQGSAPHSAGAPESQHEPASEAAPKSEIDPLSTLKQLKELRSP